MAREYKDLHIVNFSGGMSSFIEADLCVQKYGKENVELLFADTHMEDEDLYRFMDQAVAYLGCKLETTSAGKTPWDVFREVKFMGNNRIDPCSRILKRERLNFHMKIKAIHNNVIAHIGIEYVEKHRLANVQKEMKRQNAPITFTSLMVENRMILTRQDKINYCIERKITPPRLYYYGFEHNNCGGFCVKSGLGQFKRLFEYFPDRYEWHVQQERILRQEVPNAKPFLRKVRNGVLHYIWLEDYREYLINGGELLPEEEGHGGGCACAY